MASGAPGRLVVILDDAFAPERNDVVLGAIVALSAAGVAEIGLSETGDTATPLRVRALLQDAVGLARPVPLRMHLRNHDGLGLVKAIVALKSGVHHFDTTLSGLDGTVATEDLVRLFGGVEVDSPADADRVNNAAVALRLALAPTGVTTPDIATEQVATNPVGAAG
jgi:isopropylmalate/homocitrate/citramalate synthase